jgi:hypothetical protein
MCAAVVPQQPPTMFSQPLLDEALELRRSDSGVSLYSPSSFGSPAFG